MHADSEETAVQVTTSLSNADSGCWHCFGAKTLSPLTNTSAASF